MKKFDIKRVSKVLYYIFCLLEFVILFCILSCMSNEILALHIDISARSLCVVFGIFFSFFVYDIARFVYDLIHDTKKFIVQRRIDKSFDVYLEHLSHGGD